MSSSNNVLITSDGTELPVTNASTTVSTNRGMLAAGTDGTTNRLITLNSSGHQLVVGSGTAGAPASGVLTIQGISSMTPVTVSGTVTSSLSSDVTPATQNITAQDVGSTTSNGANNQVIITGTATTNSTASFTLSTQESVHIQVTGTWTGILQVETSPDGGTTWYVRRPHQSGTSLPQTTQFNSNFMAGTNVSGMTNVRVRSLIAWTGTATVKIVESVTSNVIYTSTATPVEIIPAIQRADAFHRLRVSSNVRQWSSMSEYPDFPYLWETAVVGTGSIVWQQFLSCQRLSTGGTANSASAIRQTRRYMRYQPGKSSLVNMTFVMSAAQTNATAEIGYYDVSNGIIFQRANSTLNIIRRTNATGTPTDTTIAQSAWNLDRLDGTGSSGMTLDVTKANILIIDYQWLGVGTVRIGFDFGGTIGSVWAHQFVNNNALSSVYMSTGCLPLRGRVFNTGTATGTVTMDMICTQYSNEGAAQGRGVLDTDRISTFAASNGTTTKSVATTAVPVLSVRAATQYGGTGSGGQPNRGWIVPISAHIYASAQDVYYEIWAGVTLTGASFAPYGAASIADVDTSATAVSSFTGAFRVIAGYAVASKSGTGPGDFITPYEIPLVYSGLNSTQDTITLVVTSMNTGTNNVSAVFSWEERY